MNIMLMHREQVDNFKYHLRPYGFSFKVLIKLLSLDVSFYYSTQKSVKCSREEEKTSKTSQARFFKIVKIIFILISC